MILAFVIDFCSRAEVYRPRPKLANVISINCKTLVSSLGPIIGDMNNTKYVIFNIIIINLLGPDRLCTV